MHYVRVLRDVRSGGPGKALARVKLQLDFEPLGQFQGHFQEVQETAGNYEKFIYCDMSQN
jgi:hypothetical protein